MNVELLNDLYDLLGLLVNVTDHLLEVRNLVVTNKNL